MATKEGLFFSFILATRNLLGLTSVDIHADSLWKKFLDFISRPDRPDQQFSEFGFSRSISKFEKMIASPKEIMKKFRTFGDSPSHGQVEGDKYKTNYQFVLSALNVGPK